MFEGICEAIHREMDMMDEKYSKGTQLNIDDLKEIDVMAHTLKSIAGYEAMRGSEGSYAKVRRGIERYSRSREGYADEPERYAQRY